MNHLELQKQIAQGQLAPVYLFYGEEKLLVNEAVRAIKTQALPEGLADFNFETVSGEKISYAAILELANALPFMAEKRVVLVDQPAMLLTTGKETEESKKGEQGFWDYLDDPNPQCCLILKCTDKVDKRKKLFKRLQEKAVAVEFAPLKGAQLERWIQDYVAAQGKTMDRQALGYLSAINQFSLEILENELDKAILYAGDKSTLTLPMIQTITSPTVEANVFRLIDAIAERRGKEAVSLLQDCLYLGEAPLKILALLVRHFRNMLIMKELRRQGDSEQAIRERLKMAPFAVSKGLKQGVRFKTPQLIDCLEQLLLVETELKSSSTDPGQRLERLVIDLCYLQ